jgi:hypothetical protein
MTTVTIGGRQFKVGAWYEGKRRVARGRAIEPRTRKLLEVDRRQGFTDWANTVRYQTPTGAIGWTVANQWASWAGAEITGDGDE